MLASAKWILHWMSAVLVVALLLTALPLPLLSALRPGQSSWLYWHVAAGWAIGAVMLVRWIRYGLAGDAPLMLFKRSQLAKFTLLIAVVILVATGLLAFRNAPLRPALEVLGLFEAPVLFKNDHSLHFASISLHRWSSYGITLLLVMHIIDVWPKARSFIGSLAPLSPRKQKLEK